MMRASSVENICRYLAASLGYADSVGQVQDRTCQECPREDVYGSECRGILPQVVRSRRLGPIRHLNRPTYDLG